MVQRREPEIAYLGAIYRTLPNNHAVIAVTTSSGLESDALLPYEGLWIWLTAVGGDITVKRGTHTVVASYGTLLKDGGAPLEIFVAPGADHDLSHIATASCDLLIHYDT